mgnify:CR=1 FL=1
MHLNSIPIFGWLIDLALKTSLAVPFWFFWTFCGLGQKYFYFLPNVYHSVPFLHCIGVFSIISILKVVLVPQFASVSNSNNVEAPKEPEVVRRVN